MLFQVSVMNAGDIVRQPIVEAPTSLEAINQVELGYGGPPTIEQREIVKKNKNGDEVVKMVDVVTGWHKLTFEARQVTQ